jgi:chromosome segregation ATPase
MALRVLVTLFLCFAAVDAAKVTPMEKVITLLKSLSEKVAAEGKKEAAQYDKFACFCKEQADDKLYNIEKSDAKIKDLSAQITELTSDISELSTQISDLSKEISRLEGEIDRKTKKREAEHAEYDRQATDMNEAIDACGAAIDALKDSKGAMEGAKVTNLLQTSHLASKALASKLSGAPKFQYQSNDIIATIEDLQAEFKAQKKDLDFTEHDVNAAFEKDRLGLQNEKKFAEKDRAEKEAISEEKTETMEAAKEEKSDETADRDADQSFLDDLTVKCENAAKLFDDNSKARGDELTALSDATAKLQEGAVPNFEANSKLVGLVQLRKAQKAASFVQISSVQHQQSKDAEVFQRVREFLVNAADRTGSKALSAVAVRVQLAADHFVKVRGLIKDLIAKLKADAKAEATQKGVCDTGMAKAIAGRDKANANLEAANAKITSLTAKSADLTDEMNDLTAQIAELKKELNEATELREEDKTDNQNTIRDAGEGIAAVSSALSILKGFYENAFVQTKYTPPKSGRDGKTVGDLAPEFQGAESYHGAQAESKGIVGILDVILSDFQRTKDTTKSNEKQAQDDFDKFEKETNDSVTKKQNRIDKCDGLKGDAEADILTETQAKKDAENLLDESLAALEDLEAMCVKGEETYAERAQAREDEVNALKEALAIFENWQN